MKAADLVRWPVAMTEEVLALPELLRDARGLVRDLSRVTQTLADVTEQLAEVMRPLQNLDAQVQVIERSTTELRNVLVSLVRLVPGARRALDQP